MRPTFFSRSDIFNIFRSIVINWADGDCCSKLDTFAEITASDDFYSDNLQRTYQDYLTGKFYSKSWVANGAPKAAMKGGYGRLLVEQRELTLAADCDSSKLTHEWFISIILKKGCPNCGEKKSTAGELIERTQMIAMNVWKEFLRYGLYVDHNSIGKLDKEGNEVDAQSYFLTDDHAHVLNNCADLNLDLHPSPCGLEICDCLATTTLSINPMTDLDGTMGSVLDFKTVGCFVPDVEMNYKCEDVSPIHIAHATCSTCS